MTLTNAETAILGLIAECPRHGYELEQVIEERGFREWTEIGFSSIYFLLGRLERKGLVEKLPARGGPRARKPFAITIVGREALAESALAMISEAEPPRSALLVGLANWPSLDPGAAIEALARRSAALKQDRARLQARRAMQQPLPPFVDAMFDHALGQISAEFEWAARTIQKLGGGNGSGA